jgi:hypothetical protein
VWPSPSPRARGRSSRRGRRSELKRGSGRSTTLPRSTRPRSTRRHCPPHGSSPTTASNDVDGRITQALTDAGLTWPTTSFEDSDVTVRGADYGGGLTTVLAYLQTLEATEQGRLYTSAGGTVTFQNRAHDAVTTTVSAAFTDVAGGALYADAEHEYDDTRIVNDATVSRTNGVAQRSTNTASKTAYGIRSLTVDGLQGQSDTETAALADWLVNRYKDPYPRVRSLAVRPRANAATLFPIVGGTEIGARVTFRRAPLGGTAYTKTLSVEGVSHSIDVGGDWTTTYLTAPLDWATTVGLWDSGLWDQAKWGL